MIRTREHKYYPYKEEVDIVELSLIHIYGDYNPEWEKEDNGYDIEKAKAYLAESDYVKNGSPTLVIMTESNEVKTKAAQMIQNYCKAVSYTHLDVYKRQILGSN